MKNINLIILVLFVSSAGFSQEIPKKLAESFFKDFKNKSISVALDNLYSTNKWITADSNSITHLKNQMEGLDEKEVGKYYGHELIKEKKLTESYILLSYMVKFERQPFKYMFHFYKANDTWAIYSFRYSSNFDSELENERVEN